MKYYLSSLSIFLLLLSGCGQNAPNTAQLSFTPSAVSLETSTGSLTTYPMTVKNSGMAVARNLVVQSSNLPNGISTTTTCPSILPGNAQCSISINYLPNHTAVGSFSLQVSYVDDAGQHTQNINVTYRSNIGSAQFAVGSYLSSTTFNSYPIIYGDVNWDPLELSLPTNFSATAGSSFLTSSAIAADSYLAAGVYSDNTNLQKPLIMKRSTGENTWYTVAVPLPNNYTSHITALQAMSCALNNCVAGGYYQAGNAFQPLLYTSHDSGNSWVQVDAAPTNLYALQNIHRIDCRNNICTEVGSYATNTNPGGTNPLLGVSTNAGDSWLFINTLPNDYNDDGILYSTNCTSTFCVAVGSYNTSPQKPLIYVSGNSFSNWTINNSITMPGDYSNGNVSLSSVSCTNNLCLIGGDYINTSSLQKPLLLISSNNGTTWTSTAVPISSANTGSIDNVNCNNDLCVATGVEDSNPLVFISRDNGASWTAIAPVMPSDYSPGTSFSLNSVRCNGVDCIISGDYRSNLSSSSQPLLIKSTNNALNWTSIALSLPEDSLNGSLVDARLP